MLSPLMDAILVIAIVAAVGVLVVLGARELRSLGKRDGEPRDPSRGGPDR
jgi:hypothetical protein